MKFTMKSLSAAVALLSVGATAHAAVQTFSVGSAPVNVVDPAGSGRVASFEILSGSGTLTFSNEGADYSGYDAGTVGAAVGALNTGLVSLSGGGGIAIQEQWKSYAQSGPGFETVFFNSKAEADADPLNAQYYADGTINATNTLSYRLGSAAAAPVNSISAKINNTANGAGEASIPVGSIVTAISSGYAIQSAPFNTALTGGSIKVDNIVFDLYNGNVIATVSGTKSATGSGKSAQPAVVFAPQTMTLWTFAGVAAGSGDIVGPTGVNPDDLLATNALDRLTNPTLCGNKCFSLISTDNSGTFPLYTVRANTAIKGLTMTTAGMAFFNSALGTTATGQAALNGVNNYASKWGSVQSNLVLRVGEIPEPSTYALMGLGLVGISLVARRRNNK